MITYMYLAYISDIWILSSVLASLFPFCLYSTNPNRAYLSLQWLLFPS